MSNFIVLGGDQGNRYFRAEMMVVNTILSEATGDVSLDWDDSMDIMLSEILQNDPEAPNSYKVMSLLKEINARTRKLHNDYC